MRRIALLFWDLFSIALFVVGGGYAILSVADEVFAKRGITKEGEIVESLPLFQMVPGIIAAPLAGFVGRRVAGLKGAVIGIIAVALPSIIIFSFIAAGYDHLSVDHPLLKAAFSGLRAGLTGIVAATIVRGWKRTFVDTFSYALMCASLFALVMGASVLAVILSAMVVGIISTYLTGQGASGENKSIKFCSSLLPLALFLKYGSLAFGGGFVLVPMYIEDFVGPAAPFLNISVEEFSNVMSLTQMTPGPIGVNGATYFGYQIAGVGGGILASIALLLPGAILAFIAFSSVERFGANRFVRGILRGARPASVALMLVALKSFAEMGLFKSDGSFGFSLAAITAFVLVSMLLKRLGAMSLIFLSGAFGLLLCR